MSKVWKIWPGKKKKEASFQCGSVPPYAPARGGTRPASASVAAVHKLHTRCGVSDRIFLKACGGSLSSHWPKICLDVEHAAHTTQPQRRQ